MASFFDSVDCLSRVHCRACRRSRNFREFYHRLGMVEEIDFECPYGVEPESVSPGGSPSLSSPSSLLANFSVATARWVAAGFPVVARSEFERRLAVCGKCALWDAKGFCGIGKCLHGRCGCSVVKHWLATEKCPDKKW